MSAGVSRGLPRSQREVRPKIVLGSRGSELARVQTGLVKTALEKAWPNLEVEIQIIKTEGDQRGAESIDRTAGRKGLFTVEIERVLSAGRVDVAVHSAKDLPSTPANGLEIRAVLPRAGVEDILVSKSHGGLDALPEGSAIGTGSVRRQYQLRWQRPGLKLVPLRGNVPTRLRKLGENPWEAIVLARAGLERLGCSIEADNLRFGPHSFSFTILNREAFLPAGGQGVIALQVRNDDTKTMQLLEPVNDLPTLQCLRAEREFLRLLGADCGTPVGVLATLRSGVITMHGQVFGGESVIPKKAWVEGAGTDPELVARRLKEAIDGS